jgi:hypothetical protein
VTAVTSFENRQVHRSSQVCTLVSSPIHSVQIGAAPQIAPGAAPMRNSTHTVLGQSRAERDASLAEKDKSLAQMNKSGDGLRAIKRYQPEGDLGEAKNKHLLPPPQSEEADGAEARRRNGIRRRADGRAS